MPTSVNLSKIEFQEYLWKALQLFNVYRLLLTTVLIFMQQMNLSPKTLGQEHPTLYLWTTSLYFLFAIVVILLLIKRIPGYKASVILQISLDIFAVITMIHTSGGLNNGLGVLLAMSVGISCLLIGNNRALAVPAIATIGLFAEAIFARFHDLYIIDFTQPALLGGSFFIISILSLKLAKRLHYSEMMAIESQANLASMEAVSNNIIQTMTVGVLLIDEMNKIRLINDAAWKNLGMPTSPQDRSLKDVSLELSKELNQWRKHPANPSSRKIKVSIGSDSPELQLRFRQLGVDDHNLVLIFLDDTSLLTQKAQQLKLSSLGRLTASIAHEIRNPLGAISHAAQLLQESESICSNDKNLCDMITKHSQRMNNIIENIMNLSQRRPPQQEPIALKVFLENCIEELSVQKSDPLTIQLEISPADSEVLFDSSQLLQIVYNLCDNGLRYSKQQTGSAKLLLTGGQEFGSSAYYLDIIDDGPGITESEKDKLFEPFYTTSLHGSGLGLYIARELCEANGARLTYLPVPNGSGSCFRINFARFREQD